MKLGFYKSPVRKAGLGWVYVDWPADPKIVGFYVRLLCRELWVERLVA